METLIADGQGDPAAVRSAGCLAPTGGAEMASFVSQESSAEPHWYAVRTRSRHEKVVRDRTG